MSTTRDAILFLSGAGLPEWIWDDVREQLADSFETRVAPRLIGADATLREQADAAIAALAAMDADAVTLVAHSAGGVVGAEVARLSANRVAGLLAVSAVVPPAGGSFLSAMPVPNRWILSAAMRVAGTRPPDAAIRGSLAAGVDPDVVDRLIADFTPEPQRYYRDRIGATSWRGRRGYVFTGSDRELPLPLQRRFAARLGTSWTRELATGHLPMLEHPVALAETIAAFAQRT